MTLSRVWSTWVRLSLVLLLPLILPSPAHSQTSPPPGSIVSAEVHSSALEGNLLGDSPDQPIAIYLPPGYTGSARRYPVLYLLHGIGDSPDTWTDGSYQGMSVGTTMDSLIAARAIQPMIIVMPNATNRYIGTYYANSPVSGGWEDWIARDLVRHVDTTYRTLARVESRGLAGHSMGGLGALMMGMRHPDVFGSAWAMNPCCLAMVEDISASNPAWRRAAAIRSLADLDAAIADRDLYPVAIIALASVFSPRPDQPPLYIELPFQLDDGEVVPSETALSSWQALFPVAQARAHREALASLRALRFDTAFEDEFSHIPPGARMLADTLAELDVPHMFEMYEGDHRNRMRERMTTLVLPFFSRILVGESP